MRSGTELAREIQLTDWSTAGNLSNRSSGVQIPRDVCTRFGRYLCSTKGSWIIKVNILTYLACVVLVTVKFSIESNNTLTKTQLVETNVNGCQDKKALTAPTKLNLTILN